MYDAGNNNVYHVRFRLVSVPAVYKIAPCTMYFAQSSTTELITREPSIVFTAVPYKTRDLVFIRRAFSCPSYHAPDLPRKPSILLSTPSTLSTPNRMPPPCYLLPDNSFGDAEFSVW